MIAPMWLVSSLKGVRAVLVPLTWCGPCGEDRPADHDCRACVPLEETLRRHLRAVTDQIHPTSETAPELPRAADDADMKGPRHE